MNLFEPDGPKAIRFRLSTRKKLSLGQLSFFRSSYDILGVSL